VRLVRGLFAYAALAVSVVGVTIVALLTTTLALPVAPRDTPATDPTPTPNVARPVTDLAASGRLAYWRLEANGEYQLWLASFDNSRRRSVAKSDQSTTVSRTKWSIDGGSVAYVESGVRLVVVRLDGVQTRYTLAPELRAEGYRIVDHRFSPSGARIAATVQRMTGSQTDVYVSAAGGVWTRLTTTEDVLASDWLNEDELLVQTSGGIVGRLRATGRDQLRPLTGLSAASPIIGDDGRIYFLSGRVTGFAGSNETLVYASVASIWSMTADGEDLRREPVTLDSGAVRLDALWPNHGYLLHGTNPAQIAIGPMASASMTMPIELPTSAGVIDRMQASPDRKYALGFAGTNLVRLDITPSGAVANAVVLLGSVGQGDAWFPRNVVLAQVTAPRGDVPAARYVFALGGHLWTMGADGLPTLLRAGSANAQTLRRFQLQPPVWSPAGDRILTVESLSTGALALQLIAVVIGRDGATRRYFAPSSVSPGVTWSPDGSQFAVIALPAASTDPAVLGSNLTLSLIDASSGSALSTIPGREAYWTKAGIFVLTNGTIRVGDRARDEQALELWNGAQKQEIQTVARLIADPRMQAPAVTRGNVQTTGLTAAADGAFLAVRVSFLGPSGVPAIAFAIVRARDGAPTTIIAGDPVGDEAWSSSGRNIGYTITTQGNTGPRQRAVVRDAETGDILMEQDGRFAGWSPDGAWTYIARSDGLYARRLSGGDPIRFALYGVVVAATKP
jgi:Tol biopolymer transport system component